MDRNSGGAVFKVILLFVSLVRKLAFFSDRDESSFEFDSCSRGKNEPARVYADNRVHRAGFDILGEELDATREKARVRKDRRDVFELDSCFGEVRDVADGAFDFAGVRMGLSHELMRLCIKIVTEW